ncbi:MAG: hypothetical protein ACTSPW_19985, partial [Promethearchaeota archaeon]
MGLKRYETEKFVKIPDWAGASYDAIETFETKSVKKLKNFLKSFLDYSDPEKIKKNPPISAAMLIAPWGMGKTTTYDLHILELLKHNNYQGYSIKIRAQDISNYYDTFKDEKVFKLIPGNADRFLYLLIKIFLNDLNFIKEFDKIDKELLGLDLVKNVLMTIKKKYNFFLIFIDELEEIVKNKNNIIPFILKSIKDLLNGSSNLINKDFNPDLFQFLSFILACTDSALYEISRHEELEYQIGGISRRIHREKILEITLEESIDYLLKLNKFCYNGKYKEAFVNAGGSFNVIARMAMKNPGYMKSFFTSLMMNASDGRSENSMIKIDGKFLLENVKDYTLEYMETERRAINSEIYRNWFEKFKTHKIMNDL